MPDDKLPIPQFAAKIKAKYPQYKDINDTVLVQKIVSKYPEYENQVDLSSIQEPVKKKELGSLLGGMAGNGLSQSNGKVSGRKTFKGWDEFIAKGGTVKEPTQEELQKNDKLVESFKEDPVKTLYEASKSDFEKYVPKDRAVSESTKQQPVLPRKPLKEEPDFYFVLRSNKNEWAKVVEGGSDKFYGAEIFPTVQSAREWKYQNGKQFNPNNLTDKLAQKTLDEYDSVKSIISNNGGDLKKSAIDYYANTDDRLKTLKQSGQLPPEEVQSELLYKFLNDKGVQQLSQESQQFHNTYKEQLDNFRQQNPAMWSNMLLSKIAQGREDYGENNPFVNLVGVNSSDRVINKLFEDGKIDKADVEHYQQILRPQLELHARSIPTPGLVENTFQSAVKGFEDIPKGIYDLTNIHNLITTKEDRAYNSLTEDAEAIPYKPKGFLKNLSYHTGNLAGILIPMSATSKGLRALSIIKNPKIASEMAMGLQFYHDMYKEAERDNPNGGYLNQVQAAIQSAIFARINPILGKLVEPAIKDATPEIKNILTKLKNESITAAEANKTITDAVLGGVNKFASKGFEIGEHTLTGATQMATATAVSTAVGDIFSGKFDFDRDAQKVASSFEGMLFGLPLLQLARVMGSKTNGVKNLLYDLSERPEEVRAKILEQAKIDPEFASYAPQILKNIDHASEIRKALDERTDLTDKQKTDFMLTELKQKVLQDKIDISPSKILSEKEQSEITELEKEKNEIINNPEKTEEQKVLEKAIKNGEISGMNSDFAKEAVKTPKGAEDFIKAAKDQILNQVAAEKGDSGTGALAAFGKTITDYVTPSQEPIKEETGEAPVSGVEGGDVVGTEKRETAQSRAKKVYKDIGEIDEPTDARGLALEYLAGGNKVHESVVDEVANRVKRASLNTGAKEKKSSEVKARDYTSKDAPTIDEIVHSIWDNLSEEVQNRVDIQDLKNELMDVVSSHNTRLSAATEFRDRYIAKDVMGNLSESEAKEMNDLAIAKRTKIVQELPENQQTELLQLIEKYEDKYGNVDWGRLEKDSNGFDPDILSLSAETQQSLDAIIQKNISEAASESRNTSDKDGVRKKEEAEERLTTAQSEYNKASSELKKAEDKISQTQASQSKLFDATQKEMFGVDRYAAKEILDPLRKKVKETKAELDAAQKSFDNISEQPELNLKEQSTKVEEQPPIKDEKPINQEAEGAEARIQKLEAEMEGEVRKALKPELEIKFKTADEIKGIAKGNPKEFKRIAKEQGGIKKKFKQLESIIDCLWAKN